MLNDCGGFLSMKNSMLKFFSERHHEDSQDSDQGA